PGERVQSRDHARRPRQQARRLAAPGVELVPVGADHDRRVVDRVEEQGQETHPRIPRISFGPVRVNREPLLYSDSHAKPLSWKKRPMPPTAKLRWGILGVAKINNRLLPGFRAATRADLVAIASRDAGRAREAAR